MPDGPTDAEGEPNREQRWLVPTTDGDRPARAVLSRPQGEGPLRLTLIAHATTQDVLRRAQMPQPEYRALAAFLVVRGFAELVPKRSGTGRLVAPAARIKAAATRQIMPVRARHRREIMRALDYMRGQRFIRRDGAVIVGHLAGAWGALALAGEDPKSISTIICLGRAVAATPMVSKTGFAHRTR